MPPLVRSYRKVAETVAEYARSIPGTLHEIGTVDAGTSRYSVLGVHIPSTRDQAEDLNTILITGGIHGDEPAGVWAALDFLRRFQDLPEDFRRFEFTVLPCTNPHGFEHNTRENADGLDLNRQFRDSHPPAEVLFIKKVVAGRAYDLTMEFHEDVDTSGFYLYELTQAGEASWGREIIGHVAQKYPINTEPEIEGTTADSGLIYRQDGDSTFRQFVNSRADWPQAFYHFTNGTRRSYTTETPVHLTEEERSEIHLQCLDVALRKLCENPAAPNR